MFKSTYSEEMADERDKAGEDLLRFINSRISKQQNPTERLRIKICGLISIGEGRLMNLYNLANTPYPQKI